MCLTLSYLEIGLKPRIDNDGNEPEDEEDEEDLEERKKMYAVIVSIKSFLKFLGAHQVSTTTIACKLLVNLIGPSIDSPLRRLPTSLPHSLRLHWRRGGCRRRSDLLRPRCHRRIGQLSRLRYRRRQRSAPPKEDPKFRLVSFQLLEHSARGTYCRHMDRPIPLLTALENPSPDSHFRRPEEAIQTLGEPLLITLVGAFR